MEQRIEKKAMFIDIHVHTRLADRMPTPLVDYLLELKNSGEISEAVFHKIARENAIRVLNL